MRLRLTLSLLAFVMAGFAHADSTTTTTASTDLGNVMYVGDSLTHGVNTASYRYDLAKIYTDNGINYQAVGVWTDGNNYSASLSYGGVSFDNLHCAWSSMRAKQVNGDSGSYSKVADSTGIQEWLGVGKSSSATATCSGIPDTMFVMLGTNDTLSDGGYSTDAINTLLSDIKSIVSYGKTANSDLVTYIMTIPVWSKTVVSDTTDIDAVASYNTQIADWAKDEDNVTVIDINKGLQDVSKTATAAGLGVDSFFIFDGLHFSSQGNLILAGNIAKGMGLAGRTAGLTRKSNADLSIHSLADTTFSSGSTTLSYEWASGTDLSKGYTLDFLAKVGDGDSNGWSTSDVLSVSLGDGTTTGTLNLTEAYIKWGGMVLYSTDMSANSDNIRIAYLLGDSENGIAGGYYVWLDDQLIGEALSAASGTSVNGALFTYSGSGTASVNNIALDGTGAYAPSSTGLADADNALISTSYDEPTSSVSTGTITWINEEGYEGDAATKANTNITASGTYALGCTEATEIAGADPTKNIAEVEITSGSTGYIFASYVSSGCYTGDTWLTVSNEGKTSTWTAAHGAISNKNSGYLEGNSYLRYTDGAVGGNTVFGTVRASGYSVNGVSYGVHGNIYLEFSAAGANFTSFTNPISYDQSARYAVVGTFSSGIAGDLDIVINDGTFQGSILGGSHTGNGITGDVYIYVNGGDIMGNVIAGNKASGATIGGGAYVGVTGGSISGSVYGGGEDGKISGSTDVTMTGGTVDGSVYGSGKAGTVSGNTTVFLYGGIVNGSIYGGGGDSVTGNTEVTLSGGAVYGDVYAGASDTSGSVGGNSSLTIDGSKTIIHGGSGWGTVSAGGVDGSTVTGTTTLTIKNISDSDYTYGFDKFAGTLSGGTATSQALVLENVTTALSAKLEKFSSVAVGKGSDTALTSLGDAKELLVTDSSTLVLTGGVSSLEKLTLKEGNTLSVACSESGTLKDSLVAGTLKLSGATEITLSDNSTLDQATVVLGSGTKLTIAAPQASADSSAAGTNVVVARAADSTTQSIVSLTGTGTLVNETDLELKSAEDTSFAGTLEGAGTLNLTGTGTQTFVGAGAEDMTVNVAEGGLTLARGTASAIKVGTLTAAKGTTLSLSAENGSSEALVVKEGLDLTGATLNIAYDGTVADYEDSAVFTVEGGNAILDNATIKISNLQAPASTADLSDKIALTIVKFEGTSTASTDTATADTTRLRAARALADSTASTLSAEGASVEIDSDFYNFYFQDFALQTTDNTIELTANVREDNAFDSAADSANSTAGSNLLWDSRALAESGTVLGDAREAVRLAIQSGDASGASRTLAAIVGSTINATGTAQRDALRDQLGTIRNRALALRDEEGTHFWIEGTGAYTNVHTQSDKGGYKLSTWGGTVGADTHLAKNTTVGLALTADYGDLRSQAAERATGDLDSIYVNLFGHYQKGAWGHTLVLTAANNDAKLDRTVDYGAGTYRTHGKTHGYGLGAMYELSYDIALNDRGTSLFQPLFNASVVSTTMRGYDESGAGNAGLKVGEQEWTTATLALGARVSGTFGTKTVGRTFQGEFRANLAQDFGDTQGKTAVGFAGLPTIATQNVYGAKVGSTAFQAAAGINTAVAPTGVIYANVGVEARNGANTVNGSIGYRYSF